MNRWDDLEMGYGHRTSGVRAVQDMNTPLEDNPHYTDSRFDHEQTIFGREERGLSYNYSDRLWQWDYDKSEKSWEIAKASGATPRTARWHQEYLRAYFGKKIELKHIIAGVNKSNGYAYLVYGHKEPR